MQPLSLNEIRTLFLDFYEQKKHLKSKSFSLIPESDKSLLLINSGMAPMKPYFSGIKEPPSKRMTTCQKCIRTADMDQVGKTARHGTFFEMLGSFSFGDYFKKESITWGWEFVTEVLDLPPEKIWVSVYEKDEEAYKLWKDHIHFPEERIVKLGKEDNFWEIGSGPCGPCSELYYDRGREYGCDRTDCRPGCDCDRYIEFWNHVFTQYNHDGEGNYTELDQKNIDTGMGLERLACILQNVNSIFDVDTVAAVLKKAEKITGINYDYGKKNTDVSLRIITDHIRSATFMIGDKIPPSNEGRGYVLRRLIRRAAQQGRKLGMTRPFLKDLVSTVVDTCKTAYPELEQQRIFIEKIISVEEEKFINTLDQGLEIIEEMLKDANEKGSNQLSGEQVFKLHDTYGFPVDMTKDILMEKGFSIDEKGFEDAMEKQMAAGKKDANEKDQAWEKTSLGEWLKEETLFTGYEQEKDHGTIIGLIKESEITSQLKEGEEGSIILNRSPFYPTGGGQVSDTGTIGGADFLAEVISVEKKKKTIIHHVKIKKGHCQKGQEVELSIDQQRRRKTTANHTTTHLLHQSLRNVLGNHVTQAGSYVDDQGLRFDFHHYEALTREQLRLLEEMINEKIMENLPVSMKEMDREKAVEQGALGLFEDKYGDSVRVVSVGTYSKELCGGTHVNHSGQIGGFKIIHENGIASGIRRIEAIAGIQVIHRLNSLEKLVEEQCGLLKAEQHQLIEKIEQLLQKNKSLAKEIEQEKNKNFASETHDLEKEIVKINGVRLLRKKFENVPVDQLRNLSDTIKSKEKNLIIAFATSIEDKVLFMISITDDAVEKGYHAGKLVKEVASVAGGGGGGKATMAQAGGKKPEKAEEALEFLENLL